MPVEIRKALTADVKLVTPLFDAYRVFYQQPSNVQAAADFLQQRLDNAESVIFIAMVDGVAAGFCQLFPIFSSVGLKRTWLLNDLYVNETARGKGVASALLQQAKEWGLETNSRWLLLQTGADNITAQSVYEKNGWKRVGDYFYELPLE
ncbi:N-acetyltransferase family protein [Ferruginibacter sp.]